MTLETPVRLGNPGAFTYKINFSKTITSVTIYLADVFTGENFTVTTNTGTPLVTLLKNSGLKVTGNFIESTDFGGGQGVLKVTNPIGFTEFTITGPGNWGGSLFSICSTIQPLPTTPTPTRTLTPTPVTNKLFLNPLFYGV
jgi:hypothetical protein